MPTINVYDIQMPLFGMVEASDQGPFRKAFSSSGKAIPVSFDDGVLDFIAESLELDADGLVSAAERYASGRFRAKARGIGGTQLGDLGEILVYLLNRAVVGRDIVRVLSWRLGAQQQAIKDGRFPQPDFIVREHGLHRALEVKSTEALDFLELSGTAKKWTMLKPCSGVGDCRAEALAQLGYSGNVVTPQLHSLKLKDGGIVPFPVGGAIAAAVLARDGRLDALKTDPRYRTPPACRDETPPMDCWSCLEASRQSVVATMPNEPGWLPLAGDAGADSQWLGAYKRWCEAVLFRDLISSEHATRWLLESLERWVDDLPEEGRATLRGFWGAYLGDVSRYYGLKLASTPVLDEMAGLIRGLGWEPVQRPMPVREVSEGDLRAALRNVAELDDVAFTVNVSTEDANPETMTVAVSRSEVRFNLTSASWWHARLVDDAGSAALAGRVLAYAISLSGWPNPLWQALPVERVAPVVGDQEVVLGWIARSLRRGEEVPSSYTLGTWLATGFLEPAWPSLLVLGDPRLRLRVYPDGRADLRVHRSVWRPLQ
jgi:hypothetical protein